MEGTNGNGDGGSGGKQVSTLRKELGLWDVYCVATGAMFSSGFFLLPGLAAARAGPAAVLAYLLAGVLMVPSMLSMAELATALPRAGGSYYFVDRSLGPAVGTVTGLGTWLALVLKSAFALVGMGAYLAIAPGLGGYLPHAPGGGLWPVKGLAVSLTVLFVGVNVFGAKQSSRIQKLLVVAILGVLALFIVEGFWHIGGRMSGESVREQYTPFLHARNGLAGLAATVGLVFVSYAGLTKVASISEEVRRPERNLWLGMVLSLATATMVYVLGMFVMVAVLGPDQLRGDLTPVATTMAEFTDWLSVRAGLLVIVTAAVAAFASTGNAGILSASRYPLAMARDRLMPSRLGTLGRFHTPTPAILLTGAATVILILVLSPEQVAKFGSTFNLLVFALINLAVIVMRESRIDTYDPGFRVPFYPWTPIAGMLVSGGLILEMGWATTLVALAAIVLGAGWYVYYARPKVKRFGAIHHVFARLGRYRHPELRAEFREIIKEKGLREEDPYDEILERAEVLELEDDRSLDDVIHKLAASLARRVPIDAERIAERLLETGRYGGSPISKGVALLHFRSGRVDRSELTLARSAGGICVSLPPDDPTDPRKRSCEVYGLYALISPEDETGQHLRILAELAERAEDESFIDAWRRIETPEKLKETLLRDARFLELFVGEDPATQPLVGKQVREIDMPPKAFLAMVRRGEDSFDPTGETELKHGDHLTFIGDPHAIEQVYERFVEPGED
jgi:amino acid transporter/mannitol/fructose-specific phosphotransferase system IIA component (Ntr-type)